MATLTREKLLAARPQTKTVSIAGGPLDGETFDVQSLSVASGNAWREASQEDVTTANIALVVESIVEPKLEKADVEELAQLDEHAFESIVLGISDVNGWSGPAQKAQLDILEKVKAGELSPADALPSLRFLWLTIVRPQAAKGS